MVWDKPDLGVLVPRLLADQPRRRYSVLDIQEGDQRAAVPGVVSVSGERCRVAGLLWSCLAFSADMHGRGLT
jgi:hypothetical protein